ncbi:MAG: hypothetical protein Q8K45_06075 [Rubrivivax sp.]|nr:hypothetical protein [Rubrivivax sp.]
MGFAFRQGDIPSGQHVAASIANTQVAVKNRWPDGSVKFAVVAGRATLNAGTATTVALSATTTAPSGTALTTGDLRTTGVVAATDCGAFGSANWSGTDWDTPFQTWVTGPQMSSWIYRKQVGSDQHLVAWLEVRLYAGGAVEVLPWIENGYLRVAGPTNKSATYKFTLGGTQRFSAAIDLKNHQRTPLVSGALLSHWLGTDPAVLPRHDAAYLQTTRLVPSFYGSVSPTAGAVTSLPASYAPLQLGSHASIMGSAGYHGSIGLLPEWDVLYLTSTSSTVWPALQRNAYSAGRYGMHFRDETTNRPLRFTAYPNLVLEGSSGIIGTGASTRETYTPTASGGSPPGYNSTHCPAFGYLAYLVTGRYYHLETTQFQATIHYLKNTDSNRGFSLGTLATSVGSNTVRGAAWSLRTLAQALCITPDGDVLQTELKDSFEANVNRYHARYVAQANNPYGWVTPYSDYTGVGDGLYFDAAWQQDFFTAAMGYALSMGLPLSATARTRLEEFFSWKANSIVGRLGGTSSTEHLYRDAAPYTIAVAASDAPNFGAGSGPWMASWGATYVANNNSGDRADGPLRGGNFPETTSYWGNLQPAIAYAVEHGTPGAQQAYNRMTGASNWSLLRNGFDTAPVWGVKPYTP